MPRNLPEGVKFPEAIDRTASLSIGILLDETKWLPESEVMPNSLFIRLLIHVMIRTTADVVLDVKGITPQLEPLARDEVRPTWLHDTAAQWTSNPNNGFVNAQTRSKEIYDAVRIAAHELADEPIEDLERNMRATLDMASHRVDPWVTGIAWRRLEHMIDD